MNRSLFLLALLIPAAQAATLNVGSGQTYATIQAAANAAQPGDLVYVFNGTYAGFELVAGHVSGSASAPITFQAQSTAVNITSAGDPSGDGIDIDSVDWIVVNGFTVTSATNFGIRVVNSKNTVVENCVITGAQYQGILTGFAQNVQLLYNTISGTVVQHGIYVGNSDTGYDHPTVRGNVSHDNAGNGIQFNGDCQTKDADGYSDGVISGAVVEGNILYNNTSNGFSLIDISNSTFRNNLVYNNLAGAQIKLATEGGCNYGTNNNLFVNNTLVSATGIAGVRIVTGTGNTLFNNLIVSSGYKCVIDATAANCDNAGSGGTGNYYLAGLEKTYAQIAGIFTSYSTGDYSLASASPAIGIGGSTDRGFAAPVVDLRGYSRPGGSGRSVGAYEYSSSAASADTTPPTTPGAPTATITPYQVALSWTASTDDREVLGYVVYRNGAAFDGALGATYTDTAVLPGTSYVYAISAFDDSGNLSAPSSITVQVPGVVGCLNADATWRYLALPNQTGTFTFEADVTPYVAMANDGTVGLSPAVPNGYSSMGVIVLFGPSGVIQARNGGTYTSDITLAYSLGTVYHLREVISVVAHTYSVYVTPGGSAELLLASNYAWRLEQAGATNLAYVSAYDDQGSVSACNVLINGAPLNTMVFSTLTPSGGVPYVTNVAGTGHPVMDHASVPTITASSLTLSESLAGNQMLRFTSAVSLITVTVPAGLPPNLSFTLLQAGPGVLQIAAGSGVTLIQRRNSFRSAGPGAPVTVQSTGVQDQYVVWGDLQ